MGCFLSYSRTDTGVARMIRQDLHNSGQQVWLDQELGGGEQWWRTILQEIRSSSIFIFLVSDGWARSKPCQAEYAYARTLGIPMLPVQVGELASLRTVPFGNLQLVDYRMASKDAFISLFQAVVRLNAAGWSVPAPPPPEPPVPYEYLMRLGDRVSAQSLSADDQLDVLDQIRRALQVETDEGARQDLIGLLGTLRGRNDVTFRTATEADNLLAGLRSGPRPTVAASQPARASAEPVWQPPVGAPFAAPQPLMGQPVTAGGMAPALSAAATPSPVLSVAAFMLGAIGLLFIPILFGGAAVICAAIALSRKEKPAGIALAFSIVTTIAGLIIGFLMGALLYGS
jgi:hypothetical protein